MRVYDISVPLSETTPIWDDGRPPRLETHMHLGRGDMCTVTSMSFGSHSGTHVDAPAHFSAGAATITEIPAETLVGPAVVVEHAEPRHITAADIDALGIDGRVPRVLFKTTNASLWARAGFQREFVALLPDAAARLVELGVRLVAIDYLGIEPYDAVENPVHHILGDAGVPAVEGVDLRDVAPGEYLLAVAPVKMVGAEGAPTRAFLIDLDD